MGARDYSSLHGVHTGSEAHPEPYSMATAGSFPGCSADHSRLTRAEFKNVTAIPPLRHTSSLRSAKVQE
jgi:hypothetical protein